jgi:ribosome-associated protein
MAKTKKLTKEPEFSVESERLSAAIIKGLQEKKGHDITVIDLRSLGNAIADFFIVCHGDSRTQVDALARSVDEVVYKELHENPKYREGFENAEWILIDYISVVVHIFQPDKREFYGIERFWADAEIKRIA